MSLDVASIDMVSEVNMVSVLHKASFRSETAAVCFCSLSSGLFWHFKGLSVRGLFVFIVYRCTDHLGMLCRSDTSLWDREEDSLPLKCLCLLFLFEKKGFVNVNKLFSHTLTGTYCVCDSLPVKRELFLPTIAKCSTSPGLCLTSMQTYFFKASVNLKSLVNQSV